MPDEISIDPEIVRDNIRRLTALSDRVVEVISGLESEYLPAVPSAMQPFDDALKLVLEKTLSNSRQLELQIRGYSRGLGQTAKDADIVDQGIADLLNRVEQSAFEVAGPTPAPGSSSSGSADPAPGIQR